MADYNVVITSTAERDLLAIFTYITETLREPAVALRIYRSVKEQLLKLDHMPLRHPIVDDEPYRTQGIRRIGVENYTAFYMVDEQKREVSVFRVLYNRREWQSLM